ncbi:MAG: helix-turn-helix domain-containing protein [Clostridia bacterium]|nr:helix-turn-helix domain-containing protein [Clostridia bacterium]MBQ4143015.1 helix-turn-helix domain-containing protein [Thermoguttaceae bacterium]
MKKYLNKKEMAEMLSCSERKIDMMRSNEGLPCLKMSGIVRFNVEDVEKWLRARTDVNGVPSLKK